MRIGFLLLLLALLAPGAAAEARGVHLAWDGGSYLVAFASDAPAPVVRWDGGQAAAIGAGVDGQWVARLPATATRYEVDGRSFEIAPRPPADGPLRVAFLADVGRTADSWRMLDAVANASPDLVLVGGDVSYANGDAAKWDEWLARVEPLASRVPMMAAMGNHETYCGGDMPFVCASEVAQYRARFPASGASAFYAFDDGPARFVALDTEAYHQDPGLKPGTSPEAQLAFLNASLAARPSAWTVVYFHRPLYSSNLRDGGSDVAARASLVPALQAGGADVVLYGHAHAYERTWPLLNGTPATRGSSWREGQGIVYVDSGGGGESLYADDFDAQQPGWSAKRDAGYEFVLLTITTKEIAARTIAEDGSVLDSFRAERVEPQAPASAATASPQESRPAPGLGLAAALAGVALAAALRRAPR